MFLTFSSKPELLHLTGDVMDRLEAMNRSNWDMSTDVVAAFAKILDVAVRGRVPQSEMPDTICIFSDMSFDRCIRWDDSAFESVKRQFNAAGYTAPNVVFWNLNHNGTTPVTTNAKGAALVSGFSPSLVATILGANPDEFTPLALMLKAVCIPRYDL